MAGMAVATKTPFTAPTPLTLPCTILQLRNWLKDADVILLADNTSVVSPTATTIFVIP